ncbi:distal tail protein Dit [Staphylococcus equorum]|uniref:distal tail protein Dit n=1 Tax=Staphylococcus equorum TaxID=246432 RepID=UPI002DBE318E|nr:distal tail protein Dit [Staphylococcus equorum]MEB7795425.1 phage tail family protein [Staphylococcus equorum]
MKKEVKIFNEENSFKLTDIKGLKFLDFEEEGVEVKANSLEINGTDGILLGPTTFGPFNLVLNFSYLGTDTNDYNLLKSKLRGMLFQKEPYYIWHSDMPGKKYAVYVEENAIEDLTSFFGTFSIKFVVFKGYSESLYSTNHIRTNDDTWQFGSGIQVDDDTLKYKHSTSGFKIFNGSDGKIDPLLRHNLIIYINIDAPNGFILWNRTTDEKFIYKGVVDSTQAFTLKGVHPLLNGQRVGHNSNWQWISLERGYNDFQFLGDGISNINIEFVFNYIYR